MSVWTKSDKHWVFALLWIIVANVSLWGLPAAVLAVGHMLYAIFLFLMEPYKSESNPD